MRVQTNVGKQPFMAMGHLEGPSNSLKKMSVSAFPKKFIHYLHVLSEQQTK